jgi:hypothetical protein
VDAGRDAVVAEDSSIEIAGDEGALTGSLWFEVARDIDIEGSIRFRGADQNAPGTYEPPIVQVLGCMVRIGADADLRNTAVDSANRIIAHGGLDIETGATWLCNDGPNVATVRTWGNPLVLVGDIDPPMTVKVNKNLDPCPNCIDPDSGDRQLCNDGNDCTLDVCTDGICGATTDDLACDDGIFCNGSATCDVEAGCMPGTPVDCSGLDDGCYVGLCNEETDSCVAELVEGIGCDDGDECTLLDTCTDGVCIGLRAVACGDCGNDTLEWGEGCDDGDLAFEFGDECGTECQRTDCGHPTGSPGEFPTARDALYVLRTAVGMAECAYTVCDANQSGTFEATDALLVLRSAVGLLTLSCPPFES